MDSSELVRWLYLDMNSFFASVEQEMNPKLRNKPVAVVPVLADNTSCIAVSYEGKAFGIKTGTRVFEAKKLCPKMQFVIGDHKNYIRYHNQIIEAVERCVPVEAVCSIDEIACILSGSQQNTLVAIALAKKIKETIRNQVGKYLTCSIGLGPNRYLAKIAADMQKPNGLTIIRPKDLPNILFSLKLRDLPGVGAKMEERLNRRGIYTIKQICSLSDENLHQAWGSIVGSEMHLLLQGKDLPSKKSEQKSMSQSHVLPPELRNPEGALKTLKKLITKASLRLRNKNFWASCIHFYVKFLHQESWQAKEVVFETQDTSLFIQALNKHWINLPHGQIYAVGIVLSGLRTEEEHIPSLFNDHRKERLTKMIDRINEKFGKDTLHYGATHETADIAPLRIAFTRIPEEDEA
ncbi:MAG: DNA polymerase [Oligoflexia bacterium]|nr:DNA polymerase [Oligoflexia bacterium]